MNPRPADFDLVAIRHGWTDWNADGRFQGQTDVPLDQTGREQARRLADLLAAFPFRRAVSSDLRRAHETAAIALAGRDIAIEDDAGWREMQFGAWEGLTWAEISARYPEAARDTTGGFPQPVGGESFAELGVRVAAALERIWSSAASGDVVLVATHAGPLHALLGVALGTGEARALAVRFSPATFTHIAFRDGRGTLVALNAGADGAAS